MPCPACGNGAKSGHGDTDRTEALKWWKLFRENEPNRVADGISRTIQAALQSPPTVGGNNVDAFRESVCKKFCDAKFIPKLHHQFCDFVDEYFEGDKK
jgi:hypothetical protein